MIVLGLHDGQTSGACVVRDGGLVAAVNEERLVRLKQARGFPRQSISRVLALADVQVDEIDAIAVAQRNMHFSGEVKAWKGWFEERRTADSLHARFFRVASRYAGLAASVPLLKRLYYAVRIPAYAYRRHSIRRILRDDYGVTASVRFVDHHLCHAASAYYGSEFRDALVVTMDGGGDGDSSHVYSVRNGEWRRLRTVDSYDSLGNYYAYVTALCGFKAKKHEGKVTGLAARGEPRYRQVLERHIGYEDGGTVNRGGVLFDGALESLLEALPAGWRREDLAASVQAVAEDLVCRHVDTWMQETGHRNVAVAGGIFANVCVNQRVAELPAVDSFYVFPGMGDEGLAPGAAWWEVHESRAAAGSNGEPLEHVFLGPSYSDEEMESALRSAGLVFERPADVAEEVADRLARGDVVSVFDGRMEFGPRALGHRSILYQATDPEVQLWLNERLDRTEFMPFAPAVLEEDAQRCFEVVEGARFPGRFMTVTFACTEEMRRLCPAVVHLDGTARPQFVDRTQSPRFAAILEAYRERTGLPAIINTSFNMHEEPIVCSPKDAVRAFRQGSLDWLAMGPFLARGAPGTHEARARHARGREGSGAAAG